MPGVAARGLSLVTAIRGYFLVMVFWLLIAMISPVAEHGFYAEHEFYAKHGFYESRLQ